MSVLLATPNEALTGGTRDTECPARPGSPASAVLIVDDFEDNLQAMSSLLQRDDLIVLTARSGRDVVQMLLRHEVAVAIIDVQMPEMDGFQLAALMRSVERTRYIPIIFVTGGASHSRDLFAGYEAGAVDFLFKPVDPHVLVSKVDVFISLDRHRQELRRSAPPPDQPKTTIATPNTGSASSASPYRAPVQPPTRGWVANAWV